MVAHTSRANSLPRRTEAVARTRRLSAARRRSTGRRVRFAVVGLGHFAQSAILPAFAHAKKRCELVALVSGDEAKRTKLCRMHHVPFGLSYDDLDDFLSTSEVD